VVSLPLHRPATGWDASGILKQPAPQTIRASDNPFHRHTALTTTHSMDLPMRWFLALGLGGRIRPSADRREEWRWPSLTTPGSWSGGTSMSLNANAKSGVGCLDNAGELRMLPTHRKQRGAFTILIYCYLPGTTRCPDADRSVFRHSASEALMMEWPVKPALTSHHCRKASAGKVERGKQVHRMLRMVVMAGRRRSASGYA
jgi:hypothetical protein